MVIFKHTNKLLCLSLFVLSVSASLTSNRGISTIDTSVPFNEKSRTFDVYENTSYNISCEYVNLPVQFTTPEPRWLADGKFLYKDLEYSDLNRTTRGFSVAPEASYIPKDESNLSGANGTIHLTVTKTPSHLYETASPTIKYACELLSVTSPSFTDAVQYKANLSVTVVAVARILNITENKTYSEGDRVILNCEAEGMPPPNITWRREDDELLIGKGGFSYTSLNGTLVLNGVTSKASATYLCSASNRVTKTADVRPTTVEILHKPTVSVHSLIVQQMVGYHTVLQCMLDRSNPSVESVWWYYRPTSSSSRLGEVRYDVDISNDGDRLHYDNSSSRFSELVTTLTIEVVEDQDFKRHFCCVFSNTMGNGENCIRVRKSNVPIPVGGKLPRKAAVSRSSYGSAQVLSILLCLAFQLLSAERVLKEM